MGAKSYVRAVWDQKRFIAMSPPGMRIEVGDIFEMRGGVPVRVSRLADKGVAFTIDSGVHTDPSWVATAKRGLAMTTKLAGSMPAGLSLQVLRLEDAGAVVHTSGEDTFVLSLSQVRFDELHDITALSRPLRQAFLRNAWNTKWIIATLIGVAAEGTFIISSADRNSFELKAAATVGAGPASVVELAAGVQIVYSAESTDSFAARGDVTPIFRGTKLSALIMPGAVGATPRSIETLEDVGEDRDSLLQVSLVEADPIAIDEVEDEDEEVAQ